MRPHRSRQTAQRRRPRPIPAQREAAPAQEAAQRRAAATRAVSPSHPVGEPAAELLHDQVARQTPPRDVHETAHRLAVMRRALPELARCIDRADLKDLARLHGTAAHATRTAADHRANAAAARTEQQVRATIAARHPELHDIESQARRARLAQQRAAREQKARDNAARSVRHRFDRSVGPGGGVAGPAGGHRKHVDQSGTETSV